MPAVILGEYCIELSSGKQLSFGRDGGLLCSRLARLCDLCSMASSAQRLTSSHYATQIQPPVLDWVLGLARRSQAQTCILGAPLQITAIIPPAIGGEWHPISDAAR